MDRKSQYGFIDDGRTSHDGDGTPRISLNLPGVRQSSETRGLPLPAPDQRQAKHWHMSFKVEKRTHIVHTM